MKTAILGVGNILMKDDGVGVHVARALRDVRLPNDVVLIDAGTDPDVAYDVDHADRIIVIDAVHGDGPPGTIYRLPGMSGNASASGERMCHDIGLLQTLRIARSFEREILVIGVEPKEIECGLDLSSEVAARVPRVIELIRQEIEETAGRPEC